MRPRFELELDVPASEVLEELGRRLAARGTDVVGAVVRQQAELHVARDLAHFWSPNLTLQVVSEEPGTEKLCGRFGPDQGMWMLFMVIYAILGMVGLLATMFGVSQWLVHEPPWALLLVPCSAALSAFVYGAAFIGQGLGAEQMYTLRSLVDQVVEAARARRANLTEVAPVGP